MEDWIDLNPDPVHVKREREKARELRATTWWRAKLAAGVCHYCGKNVGAENLTMDHVIPVARGGVSTRGNCVPCCKECNNAKKAKTPAEMILDKLFPVWVAALLSVGNFAMAAEAPVSGNVQERPAAIMEFAPLQVLAMRAPEFGAMMGNPLLPALLLTTLQQKMVHEYGDLQAARPIRCIVYVKTDSRGRIMRDEVGAFNSEIVTIVPLDKRPATFLLDNPGASRTEDGAIALMPTQEFPNPRFVVYTENKDYAAFGPTSALARKALADVSLLPPCAEAKSAAPLMRLKVMRLGMAAFSPTNAPSPFIALSMAVTMATNGITADAYFTMGARKTTQSAVDFVRNVITAKNLPAEVTNVITRLENDFAQHRPAYEVFQKEVPECAHRGKPTQWCCRSLYGFVRDSYLPLLADSKEKHDVAKADALSLLKGMPPALPQSAVAGAIWREKDGSSAMLLWVTSAELRNFGAAFNAFTAASLATEAPPKETIK